MYYTYILKCFDNSYYVGSTENLEQRLKDHNKGKGADFTAKRRPCALVWYQQCETKKEAIKKELVIKKFSRSKKEKLIFHPNSVWRHYKKEQEYIILGMIYKNMICYVELDRWSEFFYEKEKSGNQLAVWLRHKDQWLDWINIDNQKKLRFSVVF